MTHKNETIKGERVVEVMVGEGLGLLRDAHGGGEEKQVACRWCGVPAAAGFFVGREGEGIERGKGEERKGEPCVFKGMSTS